MSQAEKAKGKSFMAFASNHISWQQKNGKKVFLPFAFCLLPFALMLTGCRQDMHDNPRYEVYEDGGNRQVPAGTVARGSLTAATTYTVVNSKIQGNPATAAADIPPGVTTVTSADIPKGEDGFPFVITKEILDRGQERYNITCSPCHGNLGDGRGMIAMRGFKKPPSYHEDRLRLAPASHFYDVITNGFGAMYNYATELTPEDRWKIAAYIRVLQLSQRADFAQLPEEIKAKVQKGKAVPVAPNVAQPAAESHGGGAAPATGHSQVPKPAEAKPATSH
jgi:mono/diheme cytochrome c family protein